jgi:hypothetical protein
LDEIKKNETLDWTFFSPAIEMHQGTAGIRKGLTEQPWKILFLTKRKKHSFCGRRCCGFGGRVGAKQIR